MKRETLTDPRRFKRRLKQKSNMALKYASYELGAEHAPTFPDRVYVESTNVCNLDCIMCPTGLHIDTRPKGFMDWELYTAIIDEIAPFAEAVVLHSWGEPLLHKRIFDMISYAKAKGLWVETSTNATRLDEAAARKILAAGLDRIYLSMDGLTKETYEKVRVKGNFEEVLANIERFLDLKHELGSPIEADVQIVHLSETDAEVEAFVRRWKDSHADIINIKELDTWGGQIQDVSDLAIESDAETGEPAAETGGGLVDGERKPCPNLWYHCHIHWDGVLVSCSRDYDAVTPLGNVKNGGVLKTWHGARMRMMRRWHLDGNFCAHQCVNCTEWSWWKPTPFLGGGTGGKVERVSTNEGADTADGPRRPEKTLTLVDGGGSSGCESCAEDTTEVAQ
ncbi:MAG TPA: radical SAM protein [Gaiellaceae bacterium]|nr:radical SAM protein [Gaiellaceae bacterium]